MNNFSRNNLNRQNLGWMGMVVVAVAKIDVKVLLMVVVVDVYTDVIVRI